MMFILFIFQCLSYGVQPLKYYDWGSPKTSRQYYGQLTNNAWNVANDHGLDFGQTYNFLNSAQWAISSSRLYCTYFMTAVQEDPSWRWASLKCTTLRTSGGSNPSINANQVNAYVSIHAETTEKKRKCFLGICYGKDIRHHWRPLETHEINEIYNHLNNVVRSSGI